MTTNNNNWDTGFVYAPYPYQPIYTTSQLPEKTFKDIWFDFLKTQKDGEGGTLFSKVYHKDNRSLQSQYGKLFTQGKRTFYANK